jgi:hypothetical protein
MKFRKKRDYTDGGDGKEAKQSQTEIHSNAGKQVRERSRCKKKDGLRNINPRRPRSKQ